MRIITTLVQTVLVFLYALITIMQMSQLKDVLNVILVVSYVLDQAMIHVLNAKFHL